LFTKLLAIKEKMFSTGEFTDGIDLNTEQAPHCDGNTQDIFPVTFKCSFLKCAHIIVKLQGSLNSHCLSFVCLLMVEEEENELMR